MTLRCWKLSVFALLLIPAFGQGGRQPVVILHDPVESYSLTAGNIADALTKVAHAFRIPIGIEWRKSPDSARQWSWQHTTVGAILGDIVKSYPGYSFQVSEGPVRVSPPFLWQDSGDILHYRVPSFSITRASLNSAVVKLECQLAPVIHKHLPNEPAAACGVSILGNSADRLMTFNLDDVSVGEILDHLLLESGWNVWTVGYPAENTRTNAGFLIPLAANGTELADDWDLMPRFNFPLPALIGR